MVAQEHRQDDQALSDLCPHCHRDGGMWWVEGEGLRQKRKGLAPVPQHLNSMGMGNSVPVQASLQLFSSYRRLRTDRDLLVPCASCVDLQ